MEVFNERDASKRLTALGRIHASDVEFVEPEGVVAGHAALSAKAQAILDNAPPDFVFAPQGDASAVGDIGLQRWAFGPDGAPPVVHGVDVAVVAGDRIIKLYTMLTTDD